MKKSLVALAVLGAFAGAASAQSTVTVFGIIDTGIQKISGDNNGSITRMSGGHLNSNRWGIRGVEDLGGGLSAGFWLEGGFGSDDGSLGTASLDNRSAATTVLFGRRATVGLTGGFGEVRLGRDLTPDYNALSSADPFVSTSSAQSLNYTCQGLPGTCVANVRASNSVTYFLPRNIGGVYGSVMYAFGEQASTAANKSDGRHLGIRVGFAAAGFDGSLFSAKTTYQTPPPANPSVLQGDFTRQGIAASYTIGAFRPMAFLNKQTVRTAPVKAERKDWGLGVVATFGPHVVRAQINDYNVANTTNDGSLIGLGYHYNMSRRTALYATYGKADNDGAGVAFSTGRATTQAGGSSTGMEVGVRHTF